MGSLILSFLSTANECVPAVGAKKESKRESDPGLSGFRILVRSDFDAVLTPLAQTALQNFLGVKSYKEHSSGPMKLLEWLLEMKVLSAGSKEHLQYLLLTHNKVLAEWPMIPGLMKAIPKSHSFTGRLSQSVHSLLLGSDLLLRETEKEQIVIPRAVLPQLEAAIRGIVGSQRALNGSIADFKPVEKPIDQLFQLTAQILLNFVEGNRGRELNDVTVNVNLINAVFILLESFRIHRDEHVIGESQYRILVDSVLGKTQPSQDGILSLKTIAAHRLQTGIQKAFPRVSQIKKPPQSVVQNLLPHITEEIENRYLQIPYYSKIKSSLVALAVWLEKRIDTVRRSQRAYPLKEFPKDHTLVPRTAKVDFQDRDILNLEGKARLFVQKYLQNGNPYSNRFVSDYSEAYYEALNIKNTVSIPGKKDMRQGFYGKMSKETYLIYLKVANLLTLLQGTEEAYLRFVAAQPQNNKMSRASFYKLSQLIQKTARELGEKSGESTTEAQLIKGADILVTLLTMDVIGRGSNEYLDQISQLYGLDMKLSGVDFDRRYVRIMEHFPIAIVSYYRQNASIREILAHNAHVSYQANLGTLALLEAGYGTYASLAKLTEGRSQKEGQLAINVYFIRALMNISGVTVAPEVSTGAFLLMESKWQTFSGLHDTMNLLNGDMPAKEAYNRQVQTVAQQKNWPFPETSLDRTVTRLATILDLSSQTDYKMVRDIISKSLSTEEQTALSDFMSLPITVWRAMYLRNSILEVYAESSGKPIKDLTDSDKSVVTKIWLKLFAKSLDSILESEHLQRMLQSGEVSDIRFDLGSLQNWVVSQGSFSEVEQNSQRIFMVPVPKFKERSFEVKVPN